MYNKFHLYLTEQPEENWQNSFGTLNNWNEAARGFWPCGKIFDTQHSLALEQFLIAIILSNFRCKNIKSLGGIWL